MALMTTASMLLKSCAMPPVSWPIASIFCIWRTCASAASRVAISSTSAAFVALNCCCDRSISIMRRRMFKALNTPSASTPASVAIEAQPSHLLEASAAARRACRTAFSFCLML